MKKHNGQSIRLFKNSFLESLTHVHPIVPLVIWSPIILFFLYRGYVFKEVSLLDLSWLCVASILLWSIVEYVLHRFVFHWNANSRLGRYIVYLFHGLHHDDPQDPTRLVMPPVPAILYAILLWFLFSLIFPEKYIDVIMAFFLVGYLCYDYIHYSIHHFKMSSKIGKYLRRYHLNHHHAGKKAKYGVSSPLWDYVFRTVDGPKDTH